MAKSQSGNSYRLESIDIDAICWVFFFFLLMFQIIIFIC